MSVTARPATQWVLLKRVVYDGKPYDYRSVVRAIEKLPLKGENNLWIKSMYVGVLDLLSRSVSDKCAHRRQEKLIYFWSEYLKREREHASR